MGHMVRCIHLAKAFKTIGHDVHFLTNEASTDYLKSMEWIESVRVVNDHFEQFEHMLDLTKEDCVIVDSYAAGNPYFNSIRDYGAKVAYIDDLDQLVYEVDILINGSFKLEYDSDYTKRQVNSHHRLIGPKYCILNPTFQNKRKALRESINHVLVTTGSIDLKDFIYDFICELSQKAYFNQLVFHVPIGRHFSNIKRIEALEAFGNVKTYRDLNDLSEIMMVSDIGITAGGTTIYEFMAIGLPIIGVSLVDNQVELLCKMAQSGLLVHVKPEPDKELSTSAMERFENIRSHPSELRAMVSKTSVIDARGAERIATYISRVLRNEL